jgi:hypothetical protein
MKNNFGDIIYSYQRTLTGDTRNATPTEKAAYKDQLEQEAAERMDKLTQ